MPFRHPTGYGILLEPFADDKTAATTGRVVTPVTNCASEPESPRILSKKDPRWFEIATFGGMGVGLNMALRRSACADWTVFDERLGRGAPFHIGEETYAFAGLLQRGYSAAYVPSAVVFHPPHRRDPIAVEARYSFAYWLLLFSAFPTERLNLLRFIVRRLRRKPLDWPRDPQEPGEIVTSGWRVLLKAGWEGLWLFFAPRRKRRSRAPFDRHSCCRPQLHLKSFSGRTIQGRPRGSTQRAIELSIPQFPLSLSTGRPSR